MSMRERGVNPLLEEVRRERANARKREAEQQEVKKIMPLIYRKINGIFNEQGVSENRRTFSLASAVDDRAIQIKIERAPYGGMYFTLNIQDLPYEFLFTEISEGKGSNSHETFRGKTQSTGRSLAEFTTQTPMGTSLDRGPKWQRPMTLEEAKNCIDLLENFPNFKPVNQETPR